MELVRHVSHWLRGTEMNSFRIGLVPLVVVIACLKLVETSNNTTLPTTYGEFLKRFKTYDKLLRPNIKGAPLVIAFNIYIESMGQFRAVDETFSVSMYMRLKWIDTRLAYQRTEEFGNFIALSQDLIPDIWTPNIHIPNEKKTYLHEILDFNQLVYIWPNGSLLLSTKMTVTLNCPMDLSKFPLDDQDCMLSIGSYGYSDVDIHYVWEYEDTEDNVQVEEGYFDDQSFELSGTSTFAEPVYYKGIGNFTTLKVHFHLERRSGFYIINFYIPATILVFVSWLSFWLQSTQTAARVGLGITTTLSLLTVNYGIQSNLPQVNHPKAIDWFVIICLGMVFGSLVEYALIHSLVLMAARKAEENPNGGVLHGLRRIFSKDSSFEIETSNRKLPNENNEVNVELTCVKDENVNPDEMTSSESVRRRKCCRSLREEKKGDENSQRKDECQFVDRFSRIFFPIVFCVLNIIYWSYYLSKKSHK